MAIEHFGRGSVKPARGAAVNEADFDFIKKRPSKGRDRCHDWRNATITLEGVSQAVRGTQEENMMTTEPFLQTGGCHCRALRYTLTRSPVKVYACHCTDCQALSGGAFGIGVVVSSAAFTLTGSPRLVQRVLGSGRTGNRWICPECGVWVCGDSRTDAVTSDERRIVRGGTFDDTSWLTPAEHYWTRSAQKWIVFPAGVAIYEGNP